MAPTAGPTPRKPARLSAEPAATHAAGNATSTTATTSLGEPASATPATMVDPKGSAPAPLKQTTAASKK